MLGGRGAVPPYDGLHGGWTNEDSRALNGAAGRGALDGAACRGALDGAACRGALDGAACRGALDGAAGRGALDGAAGRGALDGAVGGGAVTDRAGVESEGMGADVGDSRGALPKAGDPYDGGLGCHEDSRALDGAAGGGAVTDWAGVESEGMEADVGDDPYDGGLGCHEDSRALDGAAGGGAVTDRAGVESEGMGADVGDGRGALPKAGDPYDGGLGCHEDSRALDGAAGGGAVTDRAGVESEGMGADVGDGRGALPKAGDPYDGGLGCHEDSRALDGAAGGGTVTDRAGVESGGMEADVSDGTGGNLVGSRHRLFPGGAWKIFLVRSVGAAGGNCTGVAGVAVAGVAGTAARLVLLVSGGLMSQTNLCPLCRPLLIDETVIRMSLMI